MSKSIKATILNNEVKLDTECWSCKAGTERPTYTNNDGVTCFCNGIGYKLTDLGESIIALVERHLERHLHK